MGPNSRHAGRLAIALALAGALAIPASVSGCSLSDPATWQASDAQESDGSSTQTQRDPIPNPYADEGDNAEDWFRSNGSADPWNDAYAYWEGSVL